MSSSDRAEPFDYVAAMNAVMLLVRAAGELDIDIAALERHHSHAEAVGAFLDPTAYMRSGAKNLEDQREVLRIAAPFIRGAKKIFDKHRGAARP